MDKSHYSNAFNMLPMLANTNIRDVRVQLKCYSVTLGEACRIYLGKWDILPHREGESGTFCHIVGRDL